jgi:hypothetical protein
MSSFVPGRGSYPRKPKSRKPSRRDDDWSDDDDSDDDSGDMDVQPNPPQLKAKKKRKRDDWSDDEDGSGQPAVMGPGVAPTRVSKRPRKASKGHGDDEYGEEDFDKLPGFDPAELAEFAELEAREMADADGNTRSGSGKISGEARSDNVKPMGRTWVNPNNRWPILFGNPKKRTWRVIQAIPVVFVRKPIQSIVMWESTTGKIKIFKDQKINETKASKKQCIKAVSPNELAGYTAFGSDPKGSYEWLHLIANSFGGPDSCTFPSVLLGENPAQVVANLVLGSYAANTFMMAIEFAVDGKVGIHYCVESFSTDAHIAEWIRVSICKAACHGAPIGTLGAKCRHYWIDATLRVCPRLAFDHMKQDAINFVSDDTTFGVESDYTYPDQVW